MMTLSTVFWVATLSQVPAEAPAEPWQHHETECYSREDAQDYAAAGDACRRAFEAVPDGPTAFDKRSLFVFKAVRLYKQARETTDDAAALCPAAEVLHAFEAQLGTLPPGVRAADRAGVADKLRTIEPQIVNACAETPADDLISIHPEKNKPPAQVDPAVRPAPVQPPPPADAAPIKRRPLRVAGWTAFGFGLGLGTVAITMLARAAEMQAQVDGLNAMYPAESGIKIPADEAGRFEDAKFRGERADRLGAAFGLPAIGLVLSGITLLAIDAHRERAGRRFALHPGPTGIRFRMEF